MRLRTIEGPMTGAVFAIPKAGAKLGRSSTCDVILDDEEASREHASLFLLHDHFHVEDIGSTNGIILNGRRIQKAMMLEDGDKIRIGSNTFFVEGTTGDGSSADSANGTIATGDKKISDIDFTSPSLDSETAGSATTQNQIAWLAVVALAVLAIILVTLNPPWRKPALPPDLSVNEIDSDLEQAFAPPVIEQPKQPIKSFPYDSSTDQLWLDSIPSEATVIVNNEILGQTPILISKGNRSSLTITLRHDGYLDKIETFDPNSTFSLQKMVLLRKPGSLHLDSEPPHATIMQGSVILGQTPLIIDHLPTGNHIFKVKLPGYQDQLVTIPTYSETATQRTLRLESRVGQVQIQTIPPNADILINGLYMGRSVADPESPGQSQPMVINHLQPDRHTAQARYRGVNSKLVEWNALPDKNEVVNLIVWAPNVQYQTKRGKITAMQLHESDDSYLILLQNLERRTLAKSVVIAKNELNNEEMQTILDELPPRQTTLTP